VIENIRKKRTVEKSQTEGIFAERMKRGGEA